MTPRARRIAHVQGEQQRLEAKIRMVHRKFEALLERYNANATFLREIGAHDHNPASLETEKNKQG